MYNSTLSIVSITAISISMFNAKTVSHITVCFILNKINTIRISRFSIIASSIIRSTVIEIFVITLNYFFFTLVITIILLIIFIFFAIIKRLGVTIFSSTAVIIIFAITGYSCCLKKIHYRFYINHVVKYELNMCSRNIFKFYLLF